MCRCRFYTQNTPLVRSAILAEVLTLIIADDSRYLGVRFELSPHIPQPFAHMTQGVCGTNPLYWLLEAILQLALTTSPFLFLTPSIVVFSETVT